MLDDHIIVDEIFEAIDNGGVIEQYTDDKPFPSCLVYGMANNRHIHVVCALTEHVEALIIITSYIPDPDKWINFRIRRK